MERLQVGDLVRHADGDLGKVLDVHGDTRVRVQWERDGDLWSYTSNVTRVSRPEVEPQEPEDWLTKEVATAPPGWRVDVLKRRGPGDVIVSVFGPDGAKRQQWWVDRDSAERRTENDVSGTHGGCTVQAAIRAAAECLCLPDPYAPQEPPITIEGDAAVLPAPETEPPDPRADWVCERCGEDDLDNGVELCGWCEAEDAVEAERKANPQRMPDFDALNELGFPRMPESVVAIDESDDFHIIHQAVGGALVQEQLRRSVPLDCYLRDREAVRVWSEKLDAKREAAEAGPRLGDLVTAWCQEESKEPARLTGVVVEMEDRFISLRRLGRYDVCIRAGAEVVTRKEQL